MIFAPCVVACYVTLFVISRLTKRPTSFLDMYLLAVIPVYYFILFGMILSI